MKLRKTDPHTLLQRRAHAKQSAVEAGKNGKHAAPLTAQDRVNRYLAKGGILTAAQKRRIVKKAQANAEDWNDQGYSVTFADGCSRDYDVIGRNIRLGYSDVHDFRAHNTHGTRPVSAMKITAVA
jgi:hypothetical protein